MLRMINPHCPEGNWGRQRLTLQRDDKASISLSIGLTTCCWSNGLLLSARAGGALCRAVGAGACSPGSRAAVEAPGSPAGGWLGWLLALQARASIFQRLYSREGWFHACISSIHEQLMRHSWL